MRHAQSGADDLPKEPGWRSDLVRALGVAAGTAHNQGDRVFQRTGRFQQSARAAVIRLQPERVAAVREVGRRGEHQAARVVDTQGGDGGGDGLRGGVHQREGADTGAVGVDAADLRARHVQHAARGDRAVGLARRHVLHKADTGAAHVAHVAGERGNHLGHLFAEALRRGDVHHAGVRRGIEQLPGPHHHARDAGLEQGRAGHDREALADHPADHLVKNPSGVLQRVHTILGALGGDHLADVMGREGAPALHLGGVVLLHVLGHRVLFQIVRPCVIFWFVIHD